MKVRVNRILEELDAVDRTQAVTRALRRGLIALQEAELSPGTRFLLRAVMLPHRAGG